MGAQNTRHSVLPVSYTVAPAARLPSGFLRREPQAYRGDAASARPAGVSPEGVPAGATQPTPNFCAYAASLAFQPGRSMTSRLTMPVGTRPAMTAMTARTSAAPLPAKS